MGHLLVVAGEEQGESGLGLVLGCWTAEPAGWICSKEKMGAVLGLEMRAGGLQWRGGR